MKSFSKEKIGVESPADALEIGKNVVVTQEELYLSPKWFVIKKEQDYLMKKSYFYYSILIIAP
ncbi:hypothetical protein [Flavobacterium subsaxonicum]|uniref:Uncharacterized protein n=1 Tax=Flavobacterium subsaxonicum WB 4.1-42 = DSM 21790 TaxID=1121898 RepID=A0A0A2MLW1_9FLAO|nr:hypothetical protein [Flavobacterium subsaxonicum]KGO93627.1 hypothetical protein Q766_06595 [Flavobacterium subsaxonicum WB 4.1-42 = DSM 21790]